MKPKKQIKQQKNKTKALVLFSGGLDSRLTIKILQNQKIKVEAVFFQLPFEARCCNDFWCIFNYSQNQKIKLHVVDFTKPPLLNQYLKIIKKPNHGYGSAMNPCKDCKIFMFKQAKKLAKEINANIIATGEVIGQRPMSQKKKDLLLIERKSNLKNKILRPLCAKLLPETTYEKQGLVNREKLLYIIGRNRKTQIKLAKKYKINYPSPGGGCLLCEKQYEKKLKDFFKHKRNSKIKPEEIELLNIGRHFRKKNKIILGKNHKENQKLEILNKSLKYNIIISKTPGPTAIFKDKDDLKTAEQLMIAYSKASTENQRKKFEKLRV
ncbi:MAG: tRNA 4-thiouridine(8) synthase ThiI [archaeon]